MTDVPQINITYTLWLVAYLGIYLALNLAVCLLIVAPLPTIVLAIDRNSLAIFLVGNLMTGLVRLLHAAVGTAALTDTHRQHCC